jgi:hypothetical protein
VFSSRAQVGTSMSIEDYYLVISSDYFMCDESGFEDSKAARKSLIRLSDTKNGYLEAETSMGTLYMAMFRDKESKSDVLAIYLNCGVGCACNVFDFRIYDRDGQWESVAEKVPWDQISERLLSLGQKYGREVFAEYRLPQRGSSILAMEANTDSKLFELKWDGSKFTMVLPE